ncbi:MAG: ABC transporter permease [Planctomycetes bacterium]|nr:ABC transporter permease [Planctomycetota bacterium]
MTEAPEDFQLDLAARSVRPSKPLSALGEAGLGRAARAAKDAFAGGGPVRVDLRGVALDEAAALCVTRAFRRLAPAPGVEFLLDDAARSYRGLLEVGLADAPLHPVVEELPSLPERLVGLAVEFARFAAGVTTTVFPGIVAGRAPRLQSVTEQVYAVGVGGLPLVLPLCLAMGAVIAFLGMLQLRQFGAQVYVADMVAVAIPFEIVPLISGMLLAGRSGAAVASEIGTMVANEEIDAFRSMGFLPEQHVYAPRLFGLLLAGPLLCVLADAAGLVGGMLIGMVSPGISPEHWLARSRSALGPDVFLFGIGKSIVFSFLIGVISCFQGMRAPRSPAGVGQATQTAVVASIALIILTDTLLDLGWSLAHQ